MYIFFAIIEIRIFEIENMKTLGALLLLVIPCPLWAAGCLYQNDLQGLSPSEFLTLVESDNKPAPATITLKTWFKTSKANQEKLSKHIRILSASDCSKTALYKGDDGQFYPVNSSKLVVPFGDLYFLYAQAAQAQNTQQVSWLYEHTQVKPKTLGSYLKLWRLPPPAEAGGLEAQQLLMRLFKKAGGLTPTPAQIQAASARDWAYTGTLEDYNFAKLFKSMGGHVLPDCGPYELPSQYEVISAVVNKQPYQAAIDLMADLQGYKVLPIEGHANLVKIPLASNVPIQIDFASCVEKRK